MRSRFLLLLIALTVGLSWMGGRASAVVVTQPAPARVYCQAYRTTNIVVSNAFSAITFDSETEDSSGIHSTSSNQERMTIAAGGTYGVAFTSGYYNSGSASDSIECKLYKNGSSVTGYHTGVWYSTTSSFMKAPVANWLITLAAGDYIDVRVANVNSQATPIYSSGGSSNGGYASFVVWKI